MSRKGDQTPKPLAQSNHGLCLGTGPSRGYKMESGTCGSSVRPLSAVFCSLGDSKVGFGAAERGGNGERSPGMLSATWEHGDSAAWGSFQAVVGGARDVLATSNPIIRHPQAWAPAQATLSACFCPCHPFQGAFHIVHIGTVEVEGGPWGRAIGGGRF